MLSYCDRPTKPGKFEILSFGLCAAFLSVCLSVIPPLSAAESTPAQAVSGPHGPTDRPSNEFVKEKTMSTDITIHFALLAEQVVSPQESSCPRRPLGPLLDWTGDFERKLEYLDKAGVGTYWLYGFRGAEGTMRDIGLLKAAKAKLERLGKDVYVICEPLGHPGGEPPAGSPRRQAPPGKGWRYRITADGNPDWDCACLDETVQQDLVAATTAFRDAGFKKVFFDDDLRMGNFGAQITGCFCEACIADFNRRQGARYTREDLRRFVLNPGEHAAVCEQWVDFNCAKVTAFMKAVNLPGIQVGIMVMTNGDRRHGVDLPAILKAVPDCLVRVGEGHFADHEFDPPAGKAALIASLEMHKAIVQDVSRLYSENTSWFDAGGLGQRPDNMAKKLRIEVEHGLRNIMLMPPALLDAPEYWEAIAGVLPEAKALAAKPAER